MSHRADDQRADEVRTDYELQVLASGFMFPESPRWWDEKLYFSDVYGKKLYRMNADGSDLVELGYYEGCPCGLGLLPDGMRLVSEATRQILWRFTDDGVKIEHADLSEFSKHWANDIVIDANGITYTSCIGYNLLNGDAPAPGPLVMTTLDGVSTVVDDDVMFGNGLGITPDGSTLVVAETLGERITAYDCREDGTLTNRRTWAALPGLNPDGVCFDAEGGLWVASCFTCELVRVLEGGQITDRIPTPGRWALAPMLGGPDRRTLYLLTSDTDFYRIKDNDMVGAIETVRVEIPGAGLP